MKQENIKLEGYKTSWYVIDSMPYKSHAIYLLENETYGDEIPCVIIDENYNVILDDVYNGFDDFLEYIDD